MVAGRLQEKKGYYYIVLSFKGPDGKPKTKWLSTKLLVKGNKKKAEALLMEARKTFDPAPVIKEQGITFADYMLGWLEMMRPNIEVTTYSAYHYCVVDRIVPYFEERTTELTDLQASDIQDFYTYCMSEAGYNVSPNTVIRYHANIRKALKGAVKLGMITSNPADMVERPKVRKYVGKHYDQNEMAELFEAVKGERIEFVVKMAAFYGLRRSEVLGLKWDAIDFNRKTITIRHIVTEVRDGNGHVILVQKDRTKNNASRRTLPLVADMEEKLLALKKQQKENRRVCGSCYNMEFDGYIFVDEMGNLLRPNYVSQNFQTVIRNADLRIIRFHDLRHSCASLLLAFGVGLKEIQEWLGHSTYSTTADIYAHLDYSRKVTSAEMMSTILTAP